MELGHLRGDALLSVVVSSAPCFTVPAAWSGSRVILHLDAVNWQSEVFVNRQSLGIHKGGDDAISYDVTPYLPGSGRRSCWCESLPVDNGSQPRASRPCIRAGSMYTPSSGIWRPVWLETGECQGPQSLRMAPADSITPGCGSRSRLMPPME